MVLLLGGTSSHEMYLRGLAGRKCHPPSGRGNLSLTSMLVFTIYLPLPVRQGEMGFLMPKDAAVEYGLGRVYNAFL